MKTFHHISE